MSILHCKHFKIQNIEAQIWNKTCCGHPIKKKNSIFFLISFIKWFFSFTWAASNKKLMKKTYFHYNERCFIIQNHNWIDANVLRVAGTISIAFNNYFIVYRSIYLCECKTYYHSFSLIFIFFWFCLLPPLLLSISKLVIFVKSNRILLPFIQCFFSINKIK